MDMIMKKIEETAKANVKDGEDPDDSRIPLCPNSNLYCTC